MAGKQIKNNRADWRRVRQLYAQFSAIVNARDTPIPMALKGALADSLSRALAYYDGNEWAFVEDLVQLWSEIDQLKGTEKDIFTRLYLDMRLESDEDYRIHQYDGRRRPKPFEAAVETCRRLIHLNEIERCLRSRRIGTAAIIGGSLSYGRFYNVGGAARTGKPSDVDLLLVCSTQAEMRRAVGHLKSLDGLEDNSYHTLDERLKIFDTLQVPAPALLSHKLRFWETLPDPQLEPFQIASSFDVSLHLISIDDFETLALSHRAVLDGEDDITITDYRDTPPAATDHQRCFSGRSLHSPVDRREVASGYIAKFPLYRIVEDRFYPGVYHNLILPRFEIRWQSSQVSLGNTVRSFRWKVAERLREERMKRPFEIQKLSLAHTRNGFFAPHVSNSVDADDIYTG